MRGAKLLLLLFVALTLAFEVQQQFAGIRSRPSTPPAPAPLYAKGRSEHLLTLLDFWNQELMPYILLPQSRAHALVIGDVSSARRLDHRLVRGLTRMRRLLTNAVGDPLLRGDRSAASRAVEATRVAWTEWTSANLRQRRPPAGRLAALEANAVRLDQAAYAAVDVSLHRA